MKLIQTYSGNGDWAFWIKEGDPVWYMVCSYSESQDCRKLSKDAGFNFHGKKDDTGAWVGRKVWYTGDRDKAAKMADYADPLSDWGKDLIKRKVELSTSLSGSRQSVSYAEIPHPEGMDYFPFQKAGIEYMMGRPNTLLGDDMGLGKTIQVIGLINVDPSIKTVLVICPATLKTNWQREMEKWFIRDMGRIGIAGPKTVPLPENGYNIVITNYETVSKINRKLTELEWDLLVVDEAHMLKNQKTIRYMSVMGGEKNSKRYDRILARRKIFTTGTPVCNRPSELWPLISAVDPEHWNSKTFFYYHKRYCNAQQGRYGYDFKGAADETKLNELQLRLRETCLIHRLKSEVLTELPPKIRQVVELEYDEDDQDIKRVLRAEAEIESRMDDEESSAEDIARAELAKASNDDEYRSAISKLAQRGQIAFEEMARVRHDTAVAKLPYAIEYIKEQLETIGKAIVFAHHHDVIEGFAKAFPLESVSIYGEMSLTKRQESIDRFQTDENCKLALVSIMAGGVGITLTAASHVYFIELDWVPGNVTQAEDRAHRIGQKDIVNVYHLVLRESIDVKMAKTIIEKQRIIEATLDKIMEQEVVVPTKQKAVSQSLTRQKIAEEAEKITDAEVEEIHEKLKAIAAMDQDRARCINGVGFNKIDGYMGHQLANTLFLSKKQAVIGRRLVKKYSSQLERLQLV